MQIISKDKTVRSDAIKDLKKFNNQFLATQVKKVEQQVPMMPAIKNAFHFMGDDIVETSTKTML